ncbi:MAG: OmpA family protein [Acidobacteriales bacterium]|nr:OmpA family protein [Terriglobales bacterium]
MNRALIALAAGASLMFTTGCATKKYVRNEAQPTINKTNELDELTAKTSRDIRDTDTRAQQGISGAKQAAATADQHASAANQAAQQAQSAAQNAQNQISSLTNTVVNLDNYKPVSEAEVHFAFNKADLSKKAKGALDQLAGNIPNTKGYIVELVGGADRVGNANYNYELSQKRAQAVVQYLAANYNIPAYKIFVVGLGKDQAQGKNAKERAEDRKVDVKLLSNVQEQAAQSDQGQQQGQTVPR